ncbi:MAG TPA: D-alanyl-D-alanine endopeptidase [Moraxellaceae bacterium]|nr:D-alanyl-D-alanine endopeptidase [Moraxellaceae bacterium]
MNAETGEVLYSKNPNRTMPIASITKLMTAMVVLDARLPMDEPITITAEDVDHLRNTSSRLTVGTTLPRHEMMLLALMSSENRAAAALARTYPGGTAAALAAMNRKAQELGMTHARFLDGTGLHSENSASPTDLVRLVKAARNYPEIHQYSTTAEHVVHAGRGRALQYRNTNALVKNDSWQIELSKTGFINEAGKCLVMQARIQSQPVVIVLMDSAGRYTRIGDANRVKQWLETAMGTGTTATASNAGPH